MPFTCSICGEESTRICARCTKDACANHLCEKCQRCSDCCECEVRLAEPPARAFVNYVSRLAPLGPEPEADDELDPPDGELEVELEAGPAAPDPAAEKPEPPAELDPTPSA
jgi:hypothetical protein